MLPDPQGHGALRDGAEPTAWPASGRLFACAPGDTPPLILVNDP
jgi:hypothetical protein